MTQEVSEVNVEYDDLMNSVNNSNEDACIA